MNGHVCTLYCQMAGCDRQSNSHIFQHRHQIRTPETSSTANKKPVTTIWEAIDNMDLQSAKRLIEIEHNSALQFNGRGRTALHEACAKGCDDISLLLLRNGAEPSARDLCSLTPLLIASYVGSLPVVKALINNHKVDVHARDSEWGNTSLHEAVSKNRGAVAELLLRSGADPEAVNERKQSVRAVCASVQMGDVVDDAIAKRREQAAIVAPNAASENHKRKKKRRNLITWG